MDCCSSRSQTSTPAPTQASPVPPDSLSIRSIARLYVGEEILDALISWMDRQLELLVCSLSDPVIAPPDTELEYPPRHDGYKWVKEYLRPHLGMQINGFLSPSLLLCRNARCVPGSSAALDWAILLLTLLFQAGGVLHFNDIKKRLYCSVLYLQLRRPF